MTIPLEVAVVALTLALLLGVSIGILLRGAYSKWELGRRWGDSPRSALQTLINDRAQDVNRLRDSIIELERLHVSAGGLLRNLQEIKTQIENSIGGLGPLLRELRVASSATPMPKLPLAPPDLLVATEPAET